jgi:hypothetical protein
LGRGREGSCAAQKSLLKHDSRRHETNETIDEMMLKSRPGTVLSTKRRKT